MKKWESFSLSLHWVVWIKDPATSLRNLTVYTKYYDDWLSNWTALVVVIVILFSVCVDTLGVSCLGLVYERQDPLSMIRAKGEQLLWVTPELMPLFRQRYRTVNLLQDAKQSWLGSLGKLKNKKYSLKLSQNIMIVWTLIKKTKQNNWFYKTLYVLLMYYISIFCLFYADSCYMYQTYVLTRQPLEAICFHSEKLCQHKFTTTTINIYFTVLASYLEANKESSTDKYWSEC